LAYSSIFLGGLGSTKIKAVIFSIVSLLGMVAGYYGYALLMENSPGSISVWTRASFLGDTIFGIAGHL